MMLPERMKSLVLTKIQIFHWSQLLIKDVLAEITKAEDVALLRILVMKEKEIVMVQVMEVSMMVMKGAGVT